MFFLFSCFDDVFVLLFSLLPRIVQLFLPILHPLLLLLLLFFFLLLLLEFLGFFGFGVVVVVEVFFGFEKASHSERRFGGHRTARLLSKLVSKGQIICKN